MVISVLTLLTLASIPATGMRAHLTVAVASKFGDEADVVISDLNHLLADIVLGADAALGAGPPGQRITGSEQVLVSSAWRDRLLPLTCCSWCLAKVAGSPGQNQEVTQTGARQPVHPTSWGSQAEQTGPSSSSRTQSQAFQIPGVHILTSYMRGKGTAAS